MHCLSKRNIIPDFTPGSDCLVPGECVCTHGLSERQLWGSTALPAPLPHPPPVYCCPRPCNCPSTQTPAPYLGWQATPLLLPGDGGGGGAGSPAVESHGAALLHLRPLRAHLHLRDAGTCQSRVRRVRAEVPLSPAPRHGAQSGTGGEGVCRLPALAPLAGLTATLLPTRLSKSQPPSLQEDPCSCSPAKPGACCRRSSIISDQAMGSVRCSSPEDAPGIQLWLLR